MSYRPHYISSFENESGLDTYFEPFLIPEKAFSELEDAYVWRGKVKRREGFKKLGRLRRVLTTAAMGNISAAGAGTFTFNIFTGLGLLVSEPNAEIEPGNLTNITIAIGAPINQSLTDAAGTGILTVIGAGPITAATINYATGVLSITFSGAAGVSAATFTGAYYPSFPVMGLRRREIPAINAEQLIAFDQKYAYLWNGTNFVELPSVAPTTWTGPNYAFFWSTNYFIDAGNNPLFWVTNTEPGVNDPIRYYNGATWTNFAPQIDAAGNLLQKTRILIPFKNRLLALNTYEGNAGLGAAVNFPQRLRWSQNGTPLPATDPNAWRQDIIGKGGFIDAATNEHIVSVEFVKDILLVKFERSSWRVVYTGNENLPFVFQKINRELGAESTFSLIPFDQGVYSVGNYGITTDSGVNVERIDIRIPQIVFGFNNDNEGLKRVHGIRDYARELVYWTYPDSSNNPTFPDHVLVYNYRNQTYAIYNDFFTCYGYFQRSTDLTWADLDYFTWSEWLDAWNSGVAQSLYPDTCAGNQNGYVFDIAQTVINDPSLSIRAITPGTPVVLTVINHNLQSDQFVKITGIVGTGAPNPSTLNNGIYKITRLTADTFSLNGTTLAAGGTYLGNGQVIFLNNINITSKRFSPFYEIGSQVRVGYIDFFLDKTESGEVSVDIYLDEDDTISTSNTTSNPSLMGTNTVLTSPESPILIPFQANQSKIWHRLFLQTIAQNFQFKISMNDNQMETESIVGSDFVMHAIAFYLSPNARMIQ